MPYRYRCPRCGTTSRPYALWSAADRHGAEHRDRWHDGDHPDGEYIRQERQSPPQGKDRWLLLALLAILALGALLRHAI